jgi:hypothetical protein
MRSMSSDISIDAHGIFSALASKIDCTTPEIAFPMVTGCLQGDTGTWIRNTTDAQFQSAVTITGEAMQPPGQATMYLLAAFALLHAMPQSGLEESWQALQDIFEHHSYRPLALLTHPAGTRIKAKLKPTIRQTSFRIAEE